MIHAGPVWVLDARLGGPLWSPAEGALWFTDILGGQVHRFHPGTGDTRSYPVAGRPGFVVHESGGGLLLGMEQSLHRFRDGAVGEVLATVDTGPSTRLNDATVDLRGRLWFGSMDAACQDRTGWVHRFEGGRQAPRAGGNAAITNGPAVSEDGRTLYHVDTGEGLIWAFDLSVRDTLEDGRVHIAVAEEDGRPDGIVLDAEGCLWVALWGGGRVRRYDPDGRAMLDVLVPAPQPTKLAFGGPELRTAYVTSARDGLDRAALSEAPLSGALFAFEAPVAGLLPHVVAL